MRIVNGSETVKNEFPWQVGLIIHDEFGVRNKQPQCGGSIISSNTILTAAHCIELIENLQEVVVGEHDWSRENDGEIYFKICKQIKYPNYNRTGYVENDFSLLILCEDLTWSRIVSPVCLPSLHEIGSVYEGKESIVSGWGRTLNPNHPKSIESKTLLKITTKTMSNPECLAKLKFLQSKIDINDPVLGNFTKLKIPPINPSKICSVAPHKNACNGDSGGPLVVKKKGKQSYTLVGKPYQNL